MNNIACYIRVSTDKSDQKKSLDQQRVLLQEQFKDRNILMYSDTGTGTSFKRTGFQQLMFDAGLNSKLLKDGRLTFEVDSIRQPLFNEIVVLSTSRFARNISIIDILRILWDYKKVNVKFLDVKKDSSNPNDMILLQMFFAMSENEVKETSSRTKRGNQTSIIQNRIRNNSIFGWDFDKATNSLLKNKYEATIVEFIYNTSLTHGLRKTADIVNNKGYRTKKGNLWTDSTIKTLITNPKYKGYNVRNKFNNVNLFTEHKTQYVKKDNWIVQYNDRIEPIVSEELWENVQKALHDRCLHGNRGINANKNDTTGKVKCKYCGHSYIRCAEKKVSDKPPSQHYYICYGKKKHSKSYCQSGNITIEILDKFIEQHRKNYYKNIGLKVQLKIVQLQDELSKIQKNDVSITQHKENELIQLKNKMNKLVNNFMDSDSDTMQEIINKNIKILSAKTKTIEDELLRLKSDSVEKEKTIIGLTTKINKLKLELSGIKDVELTRKEWLDKVDKILIGSKKDIEVVYALD